MPVEKIVVGRSRADAEQYGSSGAVFIGKSIVGKGEEAHLANPVFMDVIRPHVVLISGKRGSGKSYTSAVIGEGITLLPQEIKQNLSVLMIDTMGIFWSMKKPNERDAELLGKWDMKPSGMDIKLIVPKGYAGEYEKVGVSVDCPFTLSVSELTDMDWIVTFGFDMLSSHALCITRAVKVVRNKYGSEYSIDDIIKQIEMDAKTEENVKNLLATRFLAAKEWGIFERKGTSVAEIFEPGKVSVLDVSHYERGSAGWSVRTLLLGILARKIFQGRLEARKGEEFETMGGGKKEVPMVWIIIDEAHQFVSSEQQTVASEPLLALIKEGREPGISVLLITQMPNKLHPDALAQCDLVISHRLTAKSDIFALKSIMQTYILKDIQEFISALPRDVGSAVILDDNSERLYAVQIRPRLSWHAGGSPTAIPKKELFSE